MSGSGERFETQLFNSCFDVCRNDDKFYLVDLSDDNHINKRLLFDVIDNNVSSWYGLRDIRLDWETDLMNQLSEDEEKPRPLLRVSALACKIKQRCCTNISSQFWWKGVDLFDEKDICELEKTNEKGAGFVGAGSLLMISDSGVPCIERGKSEKFTMESCSELPSAAYNTSDYCTAVIIPCSNVRVRDYSLTAFYENRHIYLFDLKSDKFSTTTSINFIPPEEQFFFKKLSGFDPPPQIVPYLEGNRLRVFVCQLERLFELVWTGEEFKSNLKMIRHLEWFQSVHSIIRMENIGLLVKSHNLNNEIQYHIYEPEQYNVNHSQGDGILRFITNAGQNLVTYLYAPKSKSLVQKGGHFYSKYLSFTDLMNLPSNRVKELFKEEEFSKFKNYDSSFNTYKPRQESKVIEKVTINTNNNQNQNHRINHAYQVKREQLDHVEIVAGIKCKDFSEKLGNFISKDYVEIETTNLVDYLGAPVLYLNKGFSEKLDYKYFILDMQYSKRTSNIINLGTCDQNGRMGGCTFNVDENCDFIGIIDCKKSFLDEALVLDGDEENDDEEGEEENELFTRHEFIMESTTLIATDPFLSDGGVVIENVKPGLWKWGTTYKTRDHCDGDPSTDTDLTAQILAVHSDYANLLSDSSIWKIPDEMKEDYDSHQRNEYFEEEMGGGWFQMKVGVSSDCGVIGIFDFKYFNDEKVLPGKIRQRCELEKNFKISWESPWQEYFTKKMEDEGFPDKMDAPFGIITASGYGDGCYTAFFKKNTEGTIIAVKVLFV